MGAGLVYSEALWLLWCSSTIYRMSKHTNPSKLTRAQVTEALDSVPVSHIFGKSVSRELTAKQKAFALEVAKGSTGASAYRKAYNTKGKTLTQANEASRLNARPDIAAEIKAYELAIEAAKHRSPSALRELVIQSLVQVIISPDAKPAQITAAAKVLGTVTEVAAFTQRSEVKTITSSEDARAAIMAQLRQLSNADAVDVDTIDDAESLLAELSADAILPDAAPHPPPTPQADDQVPSAHIHTIPHERAKFPADLQEDSTQEDPPLPSEH